MGKLKTRLKGKGKRWPKGQSSNSNPEKNKYRQFARSKFFTPNLGSNSALTVGALKALDAYNSSKTSKSNSVINDDSSSVYSDATSSAKTFATSWSSCSNVSFNKLLLNFQPHSEHHKEMLAILAAVGEVIRSNNGKETTTEYFGALMTSLESSKSIETTAAILSLLGMGIKSVPQEVLKKTFSTASKRFSQILENYAVHENQVVLRSTVGCLSVLLRAQDKDVWSFPSTHNVYQTILLFTVHSKPKVRKYAQRAVCSVLKASSHFRENDSHPAAEMTGKFCIQQLEAESSLHAGAVGALHILNLLKDILSTFPKSYIKATCETLLKLLTLGNVLITTSSFQCLHELFTANPPVNRLTAALNGQLINALYEYQPSLSDWSMCMAWLAVMQEAHLHLSRIDTNLCAEHLVKLFKICSQCWLSDNTQLLDSCTLTMQITASECLPKCKENRNYQVMFKSIFEIAENGLKYQNRNAWKQVLHLLSTLFEVAGSTSSMKFLSCLKSLGELRDSHDFPYTAELENCIGKAVRFLGPEAAMEAIPFTITGRETNFEFERSWILPILREYVHGSTLKCFNDYFLPLASICKKKVEEHQKTKNMPAVHSYGLVQSQIWGLLPSFCNNATDIVTNFKNIAKVLGSCLSDFKEHRLPILSALRKLIVTSKEANDDAAVQELSKYAKNYLPILFNIYTTKYNGTDEEGHHLAAYETIKVYLLICKKELCFELFDKGVSYLTKEDCNTFMKECVMDLVKALIPYLDENRLDSIFTKCLSVLKTTKEFKMEKKCYRLIEALCKSNSEESKTYLEKNLSKFQKFLLKSLKGKKAVLNKGARLRCLLELVKLLPKDQFHIIRELVPETVLCCKDMNAKCRATAFELLLEMFKVSKLELERRLRHVITTIPRKEVWSAARPVVSRANLCLAQGGAKFERML